GSVIGRRNGVPAAVAAAKANLKTPPKVHTETAIQQNKGTTRLVKEQLETLVKQAPALEKEFRTAQSTALTALADYQQWLEKELLPRSTGDFRIGDEKFRKKLRFALDSDLSKEEILRRAEADLVSTRSTMYRTAVQICPKREDWPPQRVESFFREYNDSMLQDLTIHEAMPGHYLQLAHANRFRAPTLVRGVIFSGTFVEGWATYAEQLMADAGYGGPEV